MEPQGNAAPQKNMTKMETVNIKKTRSAKDIIITLVFLAAGAALLFCSDSMFILGCTVILFAIILFLAMKSTYVIEGKEGSFKRKTANYPKTKKEDLISFLEGKSDKVVPEAPGGLLMYIYYRRDKSAGFAQINDFDQYEYKPITDLLPIDAAQVKALV